MERTLGVGDLESAAGERRNALIAGIGLLVAAIAIAPAAARPLPAALPLFVMSMSASATAAATTAIVLVLEARVSRTLAPVVLATGFFFAAAALAAYALIFPGLIAPGTLPSLGPATPAVLWFAWHVGLLIAMLAFVALRRAERNGHPVRLGTRAAVGGIAAWYLVCALAAFAARTVAGDGRLPALALGAMLGLTAVLALAAMAAMVRRNERVTMLDRWLAVVAFSAVVDSELAIAGEGHFTVGWYASRLVVLCTTVGLLVVILRDAARTYAALVKRAQVLEEEAHTDILTGIPNRRRFDEEYARAFGTMRRRNGRLAVAIVDIDRFKRYNDAFGHPAGDVVLHTIAQAIARSVERSGDFVARYGGEEFVLILEDTTLSGAAGVAERIRHAVAETGILAPGGSPLTVSVGVAVHRPGDSAEDLLDHADEALYRAKDAGRNRVVAWSSSDAEISE